MYLWFYFGSPVVLNAFEISRCNYYLVIINYKKLEITHQHLGWFYWCYLQANAALISMHMSHNEILKSHHLLQVVCNNYSISALVDKLCEDDECEQDAQITSVVSQRRSQRRVTRWRVGEATGVQRRVSGTIVQCSRPKKVGVQRWEMKWPLWAKAWRSLWVKAAKL